MTTLTLCRECGEPVPFVRVGRPRVFCDAECERAWRIEAKRLDREVAAVLREIADERARLGAGWVNASKLRVASLEDELAKLQERRESRRNGPEVEQTAEI
jgi:hypothetical protein